MSVVKIKTSKDPLQAALTFGDVTVMMDISILRQLATDNCIINAGVNELILEILKEQTGSTPITHRDSDRSRNLPESHILLCARNQSVVQLEAIPRVSHDTEV